MIFMKKFISSLNICTDFLSRTKKYLKYIDGCFKENSFTFHKDIYSMRDFSLDIKYYIYKTV